MRATGHGDVEKCVARISVQLSIVGVFCRYVYCFRHIVASLAFSVTPKQDYSRSLQVDIRWTSCAEVNCRGNFLDVVLVAYLMGVVALSCYGQGVWTRESGLCIAERAAFIFCGLFPGEPDNSSGGGLDQPI